MDIIIAGIISALLILYLQRSFQSNSDLEYVLVPVEHGPHGIGCLPLLVSVVCGVLVVVILMSGR